MASSPTTAAPAASTTAPGVTAPLSRRLTAELVGTFWLVLGGCGSAVLAAGFPGTGIGFAGVALAFGLTLLTMAYALGHISGGHFNPAVTVGLAAGGRFPGREVVPYALVQVAGAILAAGVVYLIASGRSGYSLAVNGLAANGYGAHSPGGYSLGAGLVAELVLTTGFVLVILGATDRHVPAGFAPIPIGLALTLVHLIGIPVTNVSVNPARSTGPALFVGGWALGQLWLFWVVPLLGGLLAGVAYPKLASALRREVPAGTLEPSSPEPQPQPPRPPLPQRGPRGPIVPLPTGA